MQIIVVLNDGETYTDAKGCSIMVIKDEDAELLASGQVNVKDITPIAELGLDSIAN